MNPWHTKSVISRSKAKGGKSPSARWLAVHAVRTFQTEGIFVAKTLDELFTELQTPALDRRLATELASETIRRQLLLDTILSHYVVRPRESVEDDLWRILQLGVCQLLCLAHIPPHAAVHETVSLCESFGKGRAKGFINGILRSIEREIVHGPSQSSDASTESKSVEKSLSKLSFAEFTSHQLPVVIPQQPESCVRIVELARSVFSSPQAQPLEYLSQITSLPLWLLERWRTQEHPIDQLLRWGLWFSTAGRLSLRVNRLRADPAAVLETLHGAGIEARPGSLPESIVLSGSVAVPTLPGFLKGDFSVQDESAMGATDLLDPRPGELILDLCAAPGGKTCHIAERLQGSGQVLACDVSSQRLRTIEHNLTRLGLTNVELKTLSATDDSCPVGPFDAALVDVPCSNTGVLGKRPEARWRLNPADDQELIPLQQKLLETALDRVRGGGRVVYSTCSIDREENAGVVRAVLNRRSDCELVKAVEHWPGDPADGGYQALLRKRPD